MENFKGMGAKQRFRAALASGDHAAAQEAGAVMLQGAWRSKVARRRMLLKKAERARLLEEGAARKLQSRIRARAARKRVSALREEKKRLLAEEQARHAAEQARLAAEEAKLEVDCRYVLIIAAIIAVY